MFDEPAGKWSIAMKYDSASPSLEVSVRAYTGQGCAMVLPDLVLGYGRVALRPFAGNLAQLFGNQRRCRHCVAIERPKRASCLAGPVADVPSFSDAILRFELFRSHQGAGVYSGPAIAAC